MAETPADVRRDIELTRNRISDTLQELEQKMNVAQIVKDNPWPALALAVGAGVLLSGSKADVKAAAATVVATRGASSRVGGVLDEIVSQVVAGFHGAIEQRIEMLATDVKRAIGAPTTRSNAAAASAQPRTTQATSGSFGTAGAASDQATVPRAD
jgi:hypothetical protein